MYSSSSILYREAAAANEMTVGNNTLRLPHDTKVFAQLGLTLVRKVDDVLSEVLVPNGWRLVADRADPRHQTLTDGSGVAHASVFLKNSGYDYYGYINATG